MGMNSKTVAEHSDFLDKYPVCRLLCDSYTGLHRLVTKIQGEWDSIFAKVSDQVAKWTPTWEPEKETLMTKPMPKIVDDLLKNVNYKNLSAGAAELDTKIRLVLGGSPPPGWSIIGKEQMTMYQNTGRTAIITVSLTFALFQLYCAIPKLAGPKLKKQAAEEARGMPDHLF